MGKLVVYTTDTCGYCSMVKRFLDAKQIDYEVVNLSEQPERQKEAYEMSGALTVPVTTNGKDVVVGWNAGRLMQLVAA